MAIQTKNFYAYGLPTGIVANKGVVYTNVQDGKQYVQQTVPYGSNWIANGSTNYFYYPTSGAVNSVTASTPLSSSGGTNPNLSIPKADATTDGYLSSADWNTFNSGSSVTPSSLTKTDDTNVTLSLTGSPTSALLQAVNIAVGWSGTLADSRISSASVWNAKQNALAGSGLVKSTAGTISYISGTSSQFVKADGSLDSNSYLTSAVTSVGATTPLASSGGNTPTLSIQKSDATHDGYLSSTDWNTFNNKGSGTVTSVGGTSPISSSGGITPTISIPQSDTTHDGYLSSTDWNTFNNKGNGTITSVGATSPITSSGGTTPTISTSMATNKLIGRSTAGIGVMEEISVGTGLLLSGGTLSAVTTAPAYLYAYDNTAQFALAPNRGFPMTFNTLVENSGMGWSTSSAFRINKEGVYNIQFSAQFANYDNREHDVDIWFVVNGANISWSNSKFSILGTHGGIEGHQIAAWNFMSRFVSNDEVEIYWQTDDTAVNIEVYGSSFDAPETPSIILSVNQIA